MKRAVVLSGGGMRGAYEIGAWRALEELNIDYQIVIGSSIGAINGALMTMKDYELAKSLWENLAENPEGSGDNISKKHLLSLNMLIRKKFLNKPLLYSPFTTLIEQNIDTEKIYASDVEFALVAVRSWDRRPSLVRKSKVRKALLKDYLIASASLFPVFPMHYVDGTTFIDGMYYDNLPIEFALSMDANELIVVDLHQKPQHPEYCSRPDVTYITPSEDLGGIFEFSKEKVEKNMELGYRDAKEALKQAFPWQ